MQETKEKLSLDLSLVNGVVPQNPVISRGLVAPYHQQTRDINSMLQNQMTIELRKQLVRLEQRAMMCMKVKDETLEEVMRKSGEMECRLRKALAAAEYWRKLSEQKTALCKDLASRLIDVRKRDLSAKMIAEGKFAEEAQSSTGENGDDVVDTARTRSCKRRRL